MIFTTKQKLLFILKHTLFFALLLPTIQSTQLYRFFGTIDFVLLIMPVSVGTLLGALVGYFRYRTMQQIFELNTTRLSLKEQVRQQTKELKEQNLKLQIMAKTDSLTKLGNRIMMKEVLETQRSNLSNNYKYISIMMIDIDYFKNYNDYYGHIKGDEVLEKLGNYFLVNAKIRNYIPIRFGGEEFCIIFPDCDKECAQINAKYIVEDIAKLNIKHKMSKVAEYVSVSIGIHTDTKLNNDVECSLISKADEALYTVKENGRNNYKSL